MQDERNPEQEEDVEGFRHKGLQDDDDVEAHRVSLTDDDDEDPTRASRTSLTDDDESEDPGFTR